MIVFLTLLLTLLIGTGIATGDDTVASVKKKIDFNSDVRPILHQHCVACHGGVKQAADLSFVYEDQALSVIKAGDPDDSEFFSRVASDDEDQRMPPIEHGRGLNKQETETLRMWIAEGAKWGKHWAFTPPQSAVAPNVKNKEWLKQKIDAFVLQKLEEKKLEPARAASPERWLRRVSLDLIGLPPTPEQTQSFLNSVAEQGDEAYTAEVDRLLKSTSFGERWASVWLDAVRYADSKGLGLDARRSIWKYRDWTIRAFNDDMPYDQFTIRQLAGDLLPNHSMDDLVATASQRLTQTCEEGGTDDEMFRVEAVVDRVNTNWQVWQGLSFGCVQCHSHPYDPIRHEEYYKFMAFFNNSVDCDLGNEAPNAAVPIDDKLASRAIELDRKIHTAVDSHWISGFAIASDKSKWQPIVEASVKTNNQTKAAINTKVRETEFQTTGTVSKNTTFTIEGKFLKSVDQLTAIRFTGLPSDLEKAKKDSEWGFVVSHFSAELTSSEESKTQLEFAYVIGDESQPLLDPQLSLNAKNGNGFAAYTRINFPRTAAFVLAKPQSIKPGDRITVSIKQSSMALGAFPLVSHRGQLAVSSDESFTNWWSDKTQQKSLSRIADLKKQRKAIKSVNTPIMAERPSHISRPTHIFDRGNYLTKTKRVSANVPDFLPDLDSAKHQATRLDLANWIASKRNPLTARVAVNRIWAELFGIGIVESQEDFGSSGSAPSHPALLDDLAVRFQTEMKWSMKTLMREIVLSSTYRQSSKTTTRKLATDPRNRLLAHGPRKRLPAETIRDQTLLIAGLLSPKQFGPPVHPPIPSGLWKPFAGGDKWNTPKTDDPNRYRRSIYTYTKRTIPYPVLASFDAPSREFCAVRRLPSNTPLQALMSLNDATFVESTLALAKRIQASPGELKEQLVYGFQIAVCRNPSDKETNVLVGLYEKSVNEKDALAAYANVASVLLNLDEVLTK